MYTASIHVIKNLICFPPANLSHVNLIRLARRTLKGRVKFFLPNIVLAMGVAIIDGWMVRVSLIEKVTFRQNLKVGRKLVKWISGIRTYKAEEMAMQIS